MMWFLFKKRFIFLISLYFFPVTLHSHKTPVLSYPWKDMQQTINATEFFNFHNFPSGQAILIYDPQKQEIDFIYFNFEPVIKTFVFSIAETHPQITQQILENIVLKLSNALIYSENMRLETLNSYLYFDDIEVQQNVVPFFKAMSNRDTDFFNNLNEEQKKLLRPPLLAKVSKGEQEQFVFASNFLLEAIRKSFLPAVQYILSNYHESDLVPEKLESLSLDPLSLSLVTYASLEPVS